MCSTITFFLLLLLILSSFQGVFASSGDVILMADSDAATDITELGNLEAYLAEHKGDGMGVVIGSRAHLEEESKATRSGPRLLLMHLFHFCVSFTFAFADTHTELQDTQCGFKLFTREAALRTFSNLYLERWSFDVELVCRREVVLTSKWIIGGGCMGGSTRCTGYCTKRYIANEMALYFKSKKGLFCTDQKSFLDECFLSVQECPQVSPPEATSDLPFVSILCTQRKTDCEGFMVIVSRLNTFF